MSQIKPSAKSSLFLARLLISWFSLSFIAACGFQPVLAQYDEDSQAQAGLSVDATVNIAPFSTSDDISIVISQKKLRQDALRLIDRWTPHSSAESANRLEVTMHISHHPLSILQDRTVTRYRVTITSDYTLYDISGKNILYQGVLKRSSEYDQVTSDYATFVSQKDAADRAVRESIDGIRVRLITATKSQ